MNSVFSEQILAEKLSKLDSSQQCIETLSHWCIFHRSKAELVVSTWDKQFHSSEMVHKVPLLYLANDILQNSKRKGNEFVTEFWKVLPSALKDVAEKGDDRGKNIVPRLVEIWETRRVFGSRAKSLKDVMLGEELPPPLEFNKKRSRSVRIMKRDTRSIRTKLTIGGTPEKIVSAYHLVLNEHPSEEEEMSKCKSASHRVRKMERDVDLALTKAKDPKRKALSKELEEEENILKQSTDKLKVVEANRVALVSRLREALHDQESELEKVRTQMQVAQAQAEEASNMRKRLDDENCVADSKPSTATPPSVDAANTTAVQTPKRTAAAIAAEVADKLTASTSSQYIMSSVLSTFAAEEAKHAGLTKVSTTSTSFESLPVTSSNNSMPAQQQQPCPPVDSTIFMPAQQLSAPKNGPYMVTMQSQYPNSQPQYVSQQYLQPPGGIVSSYGYGSMTPLPPGPPTPRPPSYMVSPMVPLSQQPLPLGHHPSLLPQQQQQQQPQAVPLPQQPPTAPSFRPVGPVQLPGMVYYAQSHQSQ